MKIRRIKVFEGGELIPGFGGFLERDLAAIDGFERTSGRGAFQVGFRKVRVGGYVGAFAVGDLVIDILPKAEVRGVPEDEALYRKWSAAFLRMLSVVYDLPLNEAGSLARDSVDGSLLEIFARHFLNESEILARHGLAKGYRRVREHRLSASGKILPEVSLDSFVHKERLFCEFDVYDKATPHNRLIAAALLALRHLPVSASLAERAVRLADAYPEPCHLREAARLLSTIVIDRRTAGYAQALEYARLILLSLCPAQRPGESESLALLFRMNDLFEGYVGKLVRRAAQARGWNASLQSSTRFWERQTIRPDIVLELPQRRVILDTKWKVLRTATPSIEDVRQMYAYNRFFDADRAVLIYPQVYDLPNRSGSYHGPDHGLSCELFFVPLFENGGLIPSLGEQIICRIGRSEVPEFTGQKAHGAY
jgi:5-methylcytosine-specific restriction enzyme subunit McrC